MIILWFILGGVYTIALIAGGIYIGYLFGKQKLEEKVEQVVQRATIKARAKTSESGAVKVIGAQDKAVEDDPKTQAFVQKLTGLKQEWQ